MLLNPDIQTYGRVRLYVAMLQSAIARAYARTQGHVRFSLAPRTLAPPATAQIETPAHHPLEQSVGAKLKQPGGQGRSRGYEHAPRGGSVGSQTSYLPPDSVGGEWAG
eukprot:3846171-Pleurochrysis_carterae.AAC.2